SVLLAPGSYLAGAAGAGAAMPLLRSATTTPCGAGTSALVTGALAAMSYAVCTGPVCTVAVCIAPGVAVRPSMANASVGMIFMRASPIDLCCCYDRDPAGSRQRIGLGRQLLKPPRRFGRAEARGALVPQARHRFVRRKPLDSEFLDCVRVVGAGERQRRVHVAGFRRALQHQPRRCKIAGADEAFAATH